jgi:signal transduction histidine kinase
MHGLDGLETARLIRDRPRSQHTPIIFLTAYDSATECASKAYALGAVDFLVKPLVPVVLRSKVAVFVELFRKSEQVKQQAEELHLLQQQEFDRQLAAARHSWDLERARAEAAQEKLAAAQLAQKAEELARLNQELQAEATERKRAEQERRQLEAQVLHAQKLESLGVLAGGIAHDFNNLLTSVLGHAGLALEVLPAESVACGYVQSIEIAALRAAELTQQMLAYSGKGRFVIQSLCLSGVVEEMAGLLRSVISKRAELRFDFAAELPPIEADPAQIRQVVMNLLTNAAESFGEGSGVITIRTRPRQLDGSFLGLMPADVPLSDERGVCLEVADTGCGMDAATQARIFDPFFTTKFTGRGLGLAAVQGIVRSHGGSIQVESQPGQGTTFRIWFPCQAGQVPAALAGSAARLGGHGAGAVLVVDDEASVRGVAGHCLQRAGFQPLPVEDGAAAVEMFRQRSDQIVAVLLDLTMPHMSGDEVYQELRRLRAHLPIVLMSGYTEQEAASRLDFDGPTEFLQKPFRPADLVEAIRRVMKKGQEGRTKQTHFAMKRPVLGLNQARGASS